MCRAGFFPSIPSLSDHPFIYFEVDRSCSSHHSESNHSPRPPHISRIDISVLRLKVASSIGRIKLPTALSETQLELLVSELANVLSSAACESRCNIPSPQNRGMPWWNKDLCALRHKTRQAFKHWSANRSMKIGSSFLPSRQTIKESYDVQRGNHGISYVKLTPIAMICFQPLKNYQEKQEVLASQMLYLLMSPP